MKPIGIYVHIPFCAAHCSYCHFVIDLARGEVHERYGDALTTEIAQWGQRLSSQGRQRADSLYIGGGTPSWIPAHLIRGIVRTLRENFLIDAEAETTIEVNPDSIDEEKIQAYREVGINRISVGVQSFHDEELKRLGRTHSARDAEKALRQLRRSGMNNLSIDLIAGLPGQTMSHWKANIEHLASLGPEHVSLYLFDEDEGSTLGRKRLQRAVGPEDKVQGSTRWNLPDEDEVKRIYDFAVLELDRLGYEQYEISNFARRVDPWPSPPGSFRSRHNLKYWNMHPYLGLGCAAHSFLFPERWRNENSTEGYIQSLLSKNDPRREIDEISLARLAEDAFIFGLRQTEGIHYPSLSTLLGRDARSLFRPVIDPLLAEGWFIEREDTLRLAPQAFLVSNEIFERFIGAEEQKEEVH